MKKVRSKAIETDEMLPEYELEHKKGVRGKYYKAYQQGHEVRVYQEDGRVQIQHFTLEDGAVLLAPDVRQYFPDALSVNKALRGLIELIPHVSSDANA